MQKHKLSSSLPVILSLVILLVLTIGACSGQDAPDTPTAPSVATQSCLGNTGNHILWGYWEGYIPETHDTLELVPVRGSMIHLNARRFLEVAPCTNCIQLVDLNIDPSSQILTAEIRLTHPFPGFAKYTGFDVRAVIISDGSLYFPELDAMVPCADLGDFTLINADGYTRLWNTVEFPPGSGQFKFLEYSQGNLASPGDFTGTVNPYIAYNQEPRFCFPAGAAMNRVFVFKMPAGALRFGYAVDASWEPPTVDPPVNIKYDFPPSANALEPYVFSITQQELFDEIGSTANASIDIADIQGGLASSAPKALLEAPDLWSGTLEPSIWGWEMNPPPPFRSRGIAAFDLVNETGAPPGTYRALFRIEDKAHDTYLGDINHAYKLFDITVTEQIQPQFEGEMVFTAPEPPTGGPPPALNVWHMNMETMVETQLTSFVGVGTIFEEPRINPAGTHMLLTSCPTPMASYVGVYEIGGSSWSITPSETYDGHADFHPDGEHILIASGTQYADVKELYSTEYDGSDRTLIATAPHTIRNPRWSPDGTRIAMTLKIEVSDPPNSELWIYDVDTRTFTEIMSAGGVDENPSWSPVKVDGAYLIVYASSRDHHPDYETDIYVVNPDTEEILCHFDMGGYERHPSFSPDGLSFVFQTPGENSEELWIYSWKTAELTQLTDDDTYDGSPSWGWNW